MLGEISHFGTVMIMVVKMVSIAVKRQRVDGINLQESLIEIRKVIRGVLRMYRTLKLWHNRLLFQSIKEAVMVKEIHQNLSLEVQTPGRIYTEL
jgi:hypothetical protein